MSTLRKPYLSSERHFGLVGRRLGHSFSQRFFTGKFEAEGICASYRNYEIESVDGILPLLEADPLLSGLNVTIPYKEHVIPLLSGLSDEAREIGAVNTIVVDRLDNGSVGSLIGFNTDCIGFRETLRPYLRPDITDALVLGSGGASKAVCHALRQLGINPTTVSRSEGPDRIAYGQLDSAVMQSHLLIVNTTPLGMWPDTESAPSLPYELITARHLCYDLVYNPVETGFMRLAARQGATVVGGLAMLHAQALESWSIWNRSAHDFSQFF